MLDYIGTEVVAHRVGIPVGGIEQTLNTIRRGFAEQFRRSWRSVPGTCGCSTKTSIIG